MQFAPGLRRFEDYKLIESYFHSALTLLTHVKVAFDGRLPYLDAETDVSKLMNACQDGDEKNYMIKTDKYVNEKHRSKCIKVSVLIKLTVPRIQFRANETKS